MKEEFLHYIWQNKLFKQKEYITDSGDTIEIIDTGIPNSDSGPDFFNAKIKSGNTVWAGNIEIHCKSSDWKIHQHHKNEAYNNVILHVVYKNNESCFNSKNIPVSTIELCFPDHLLNNYNQLLKNNHWISCENKISEIDPVLISLWKETLAIDRIQSKTAYIERVLLSNQNNWEESYYQVLARSFGFGVNSDPFELLARSVPLKILSKHKNNLAEIEAILFGQSGILEMNEPKDNYIRKLWLDYQHLKTKYKLMPMKGHLWKFLRLRPGNFPTIRIAQFASLIYHASHLLSKICEEENVNKLKQLFNVSTSSYWKDHYLFGKKGNLRSKILGDLSVNSIIINSVAPFLYLYGKKNNKTYLKERSLEILHNLPVEKNNLIDQWIKLGMDIRDSYDSQAFIQLKKQYCDQKKCLQCMIGNKIIIRES